MFKVNSAIGSTKASPALDVRFVAVIPVAMSPITDAGGSGGGGGTSPQLILPANAERLTVIARIVAAQKWHRRFIVFSCEIIKRLKLVMS
jgi:hypothetical protein